jgi:hypothetical protein
MLTMALCRLAGVLFRLIASPAILGEQNANNIGASSRQVSAGNYRAGTSPQQATGSAGVFY